MNKKYYINILIALATLLLSFTSYCQITPNSKTKSKQLHQKTNFLDSLESVIKHQKHQINLQDIYLEQQLNKIIEQKKILSIQKKEIQFKSNQAYIAYTLAGFTLLIIFFILRSYRLKKDLNKELLLKNIAIKQKTKVLENQKKEMEQFAYIASHDLQEPLNTISSFIQLLDEQYKASMDDIGKQSVVYIGQASLRMKALISSLLEYSRLGKKHNLELVNCNFILNDLKKDLKELICSSQATINVGVLPSIQANKVEIRLLFQNLISNAIKFTPNDRVPKIKVNCKKEIIESQDEYEQVTYKFSVTDNGIGIKPEHLKKIFAIFQRLHNSDKYKGTGIGLAHCKKIVNSHGGQIGVSSEKNKGSIFWFTIPQTKKYS